MAVLHIALESGFSGDVVVVAVDGKEVLRETLSTRMQIGLAEEVHVAVDAGRHTLTVAARGATAEVTVDVEEELYIGLSLARSGDAIDHRVSPRPFGYL